jgi:4-amino-4-deoxy-L-arabinose transferase-like glycosyltransferase
VVSLHPVAEKGVASREISIPNMSSESSGSKHSPSRHHFNKHALLFLIFLALFAFFFNLGGRPIETKDYLRYAEIAREILEFDDWIMLRLTGRIYVDKPPLHFWMIAGAYKIFGVNPLAARLPSAVAAFCAVLLTFLFVKRKFGNTQTAFLAAVILMSSYDFLWWARRTRIDMVFSFFFSASLVFFYWGCESPSNRRKTLWYIAFWLATGFAFMDKAFIAFANLAVVIPYSVMVAFKPDGRTVKPVLLTITSPVVLLPTLPWIIALINHPQFAVFWKVLDQTTIMDRREAFYYYILQMPLKLLPTTPFLTLGVWGYIRHRKKLVNYRELSYSLLWIIAYLFILHLTAAKSARYLLPLYLPCSLLSAWAIQFFLNKKNEALGFVLRWGDRILLGAAVLSLSAPLVIAHYYGVSMQAALLYTISMGAALLITRKFLTYKTAGLFVSFIILILVIDVVDTVGREKASAYFRMTQILKNENLQSEQIGFHNCSSRAREVLSFYFNQLMHCSDSWPDLRQNPKIRAIVTTNQAIEDKFPSADLTNNGRIIPGDKGYVMFIKLD